MHELASSYLLGGLIQALELDIEHADATTGFPCCPVICYTAGRNTVLGRFRGEIGLALLNDYRSALASLVSGNVMKIILDFQAATLSKTAVGELVTFAGTVFGRQKRLYLYRPSKQVQQQLHELGLTPFFSSLATEDDILATLVV